MNHSLKPKRPTPLNSLTASALRIKNQKMEKRLTLGSSDWQSDAWDLYEQVGEQRFLATTLANRMSQAYFYVGELTDDLDDPVETEEETLKQVLAGVGHNAAGLAQIIQRLGLNLFIAGEGWLAGIPRDMMPDTVAIAAPSGRENPPLPAWLDGLYDDEDIDIMDLEWRMLSVDEVSTTPTDAVKLILGEDDNSTLEVDPEDIYLFRIWRPHPRRAWEADSPTRSSLPVLRELAGLTMHVSAQVDSRLAGAGVLIVPQSAQDALRQSMADPETGEEPPEDAFTDALIEAMVTPISDRSSASAVVPLVLTVPDQSADKFRHISFASELDNEARELRSEAIHRLAIGQDAPPELLLGTAGMNHWGAWLVNEDTVTTHLEPPLALICDALTTQYLWPVMYALGYTEEEVKRHVIWYSVEHMIVRPNRGRDALALYEKGELDGKSLRETLGFGEDDAPEEASEMPPAVALAMDMVRNAPSLASDPGLPALIAQIQEALDGSPGDSGDAAGGTGGEGAAGPSEDAPEGSEGQESGGGADDPDAPPSIPETDDAPAPVEVVG